MHHDYGLEDLLFPPSGTTDTSAFVEQNDPLKDSYGMISLTGFILYSKQLMWPFIHHSWSEPLGKVMFRDSVWHKAVSKLGFPDGSVKNLPAVWEIQVRSLGQEDPLEKEMANHSSILARKIPWTEF